MQKIVGKIASIGLTALAAPVAAQDYYAGGALSFGTFNAEGESNEEEKIQSVDLFGGARFDVGSNVFVGIEVQVSSGEGYPSEEPYLEARNAMYQGEIHIGYDMEQVLIYAFAGVGSTNFDRTSKIDDASVTVVGGIGAEIPVSDNMSIRVETELTKLSIEDNCCGLYDPVKQADLSAGVIFKF